jgi:hypothetical protein
MMMRVPFVCKEVGFDLRVVVLGEGSETWKNIPQKNTGLKHPPDIFVQIN